jgi:hypothetical protein
MVIRNVARPRRTVPPFAGRESIICLRLWPGFACITGRLGLSPLPAHPHIRIAKKLKHFHEGHGKGGRCGANRKTLIAAIGYIHYSSPRTLLHSARCKSYLKRRPIRAQIDSYLLDLITREYLNRSWFIEERDGNCRLTAEFVSRLAQTAPIWSRAVAPVAEWVAREFWKTIRRPDIPFATRLTQSNKREAKGAAPVPPPIKPTRREHICPECGNLLRLFQSGKSVRLVTTNFDSHFTNAAHTIFTDKEAEVFYAPALPLGNPFQGIVYLHGSVEKSPESLVLTDSDFGRAYLTEGWARRFLQQLFSRYTVLFIGYSHNDIVMEYLARGLPPQADHPGRYALKILGNADDVWIYRGIKPVSYPDAQGLKKLAS